MKHLAATAIIAVSLVAFAPSAAIAAADNYAFEAQQAQVPAGNDAVISVQLVNTATGKPVGGAVIFQTRLDMSPDNMAAMTAAATPLPPDEPGVYRFQVNLGMAGQWALKLAAKVPGEPETVHGDVIVTATK